jgi:site-specific DNA-adenine methylase
MNKNHFFYAYYGNKRTEAVKLYNLLNLDNIKLIIEPFCGSCAVSYYISRLHPKQFKYILNDKNEDLINLFKLLKDETKKNKTEEIINNWCAEINKLLDNETELKKLYNNIIKLNTFESVLFSKRYYCIRAGLCRLDKDKNGLIRPYKSFYFKDYPIYDFFINEDIELYNEEGNIIYEKYKSNKEALLILDPPYMETNNQWYNSGTTIGNFNIYEYLAKNSIGKEKASIYLILENMWITKLLFKDYIIDEYNKLYQTSKRKTVHIIVSNQKKQLYIE